MEKKLQQLSALQKQLQEERNHQKQEQSASSSQGIQMQSNFGNKPLEKQDHELYQLLKDLNLKQNNSLNLNTTFQNKIHFNHQENSSQMSNIIKYKLNMLSKKRNNSNRFGTERLSSNQEENKGELKFSNLNQNQQIQQNLNKRIVRNQEQVSVNDIQKVRNLNQIMLSSAEPNHNNFQEQQHIRYDQIQRISPPQVPSHPPIFQSTSLLPNYKSAIFNSKLSISQFVSSPKNVPMFQQLSTEFIKDKQNDYDVRCPQSQFQIIKQQQQNIKEIIKANSRANLMSKNTGQHLSRQINKQPESNEENDYFQRKRNLDEAKMSQTKNSEISEHSKLESWGKSATNSIQNMENKILKQKKSFNQLLPRKKSSNNSRQTSSQLGDINISQKINGQSAVRSSKTKILSAYKRFHEDDKTNLRNVLRIMSHQNASNQYQNVDDKINIINQYQVDSNQNYQQASQIIIENTEQTQQNPTFDNNSRNSQNNSMQKSRSQSGPMSNESEVANIQEPVIKNHIQKQIFNETGINKQHQSFNNKDLMKLINTDSELFQYPVNYNQNYFQQMNDYTSQYAFQKRQKRLQQQSKLYSQNLGKIADFKRKIHSRSQKLENKDLPPDKNFLKKNINQISQIQISKNEQQAQIENNSKTSNQNIISENSKKYERLKKLMQKTSNLKNQTSEMSINQNQNQQENAFHSFINDYSKQDQKQQFIDNKKKNMVDSLAKNLTSQNQQKQNIFMSTSPILSAQYSQSQFDSNVEDFQKSQLQNQQDDSSLLKSFFQNKNALQDQREQINIQINQNQSNQIDYIEQQSMQKSEENIQLPTIIQSPKNLNSQMQINLQFNQPENHQKQMIKQENQTNQKQSQNGKLQLPQFSFRNKSGHVDRKQKNQKQMMNRQKSVALSKDMFTNTTDVGGDLNKISQNSIQFKISQDDKKRLDSRENQNLSNDQKDNLSGSLKQVVHQNHKSQKQFLKPVSGYKVLHKKISNFNKIIQGQIVETSLLKRRPSLNASGQTKKHNLLNQSLLQKFTGRKSSAIISQRKNLKSHSPLQGNTVEKISNSSSQQMLFLHGSNITSFYNNNSKIIKGQQVSQFVKNDLSNTSFITPILDAKGNLAYEPKHRKPKWVLPQEYERFKKFEDQSLIKDSSRNDYIRIENPFERQIDNNKIFDHIRADEIGKYMNGVSYLEKLKLSKKTFLLTQPQLLNQKMMYSEFLITYQIEKAFLTVKLNKSLYQKFVFMNFYNVLRNPHKNQKMLTSYVQDFANDQIFKDFNKSLRRCRQPQEIKIFVKYDLFKELSYEWFDIFDPVSTQQQLQIYGEQVPEYFEKQNEEVLSMHSIMEKRSDFDNIQPEFGEEVIEQLDNYIQQIVLIQKPVNKQSQESIDKRDLEIVYNDLSKSFLEDQKQLQMNFNPLIKQKNKQVSEKHRNFFNFQEQSKVNKYKMQQKIQKEFDNIDILIVQFGLIEQSSYKQQSNQQDYKTRKIVENKVYEAKRLQTQIILNSEIYIEKQKNKMETRLSIINNLPLKEKGILAFYRHKNPHPEIFYSIWINNFNFEQQNEFYYKWYSQNLKDQSISNPSEFNGFYKIFRYFETKESRIQEFQSKKQINYKDNNSYQDYIKLIHRVFTQKYVSIFDKDKHILRNQEQADKNIQNIMQLLPHNNNPINKIQSLNDNFIKKQITMLQIDLNEQLNFVEPLPLNIELKFNNLLYINNISEPIFDENFGVLTYEYFEITYPISQDFNSNKKLQISLQQILKERMAVQLKLANRIILKEDKIIKQTILKWNDDKHQQESQYKQNESLKQKKKKRRNSFTEKTDLEVDQDLRQLYKKIEFQEQLPFTTDLMIKQPEHLEIVYKGEEIFFEPEKPVVQSYESKNIEALIFSNFNNRNLTFNYIGNLFITWQQKVEEFQNKLQNFNYSQLMPELKEQQDQQNYENNKSIYKLWLDLYNDKEIDNTNLQLNDESKQIKKKKLKLFKDMTKKFELERYKKLFKSKNPLSEYGDQIQKILILKFTNKIRQFNQKSEKSAIYFPTHAMFLKLGKRKEILNIVKMGGQLSDRDYYKEIIESEEKQSEILEIIEIKHVEKPQIKKVRELQLTSSEKVSQYIDKQLRKEIEDAVSQGNVKLLTNFTDQFQRCFKERSDTKSNFKNLQGQTILHQALLMNYDKGNIDKENESSSQEDQQASQENKEDKLEEVFNFVKKKLQKIIIHQPQLKQQLQNESGKSLKIKKQIVELLVNKMNADPNIKDKDGLTAFDIANCLKHSDAILEILQKHSLQN